MIPSPALIYHITPITNLERIVEGGQLLSNNMLQQDSNSYTSIAHQTIQDRRARIRVPCGPGGTLHDYVPFYFGPRSPMLYAINRGNVASFTGGQRPIVHLTTTIEAITAEGCRFAFTDGHAIMAYSQFYDDLTRLDAIDWDLMRSTWWNDTPEYPDRCRRRQAEFLIFESCPWSVVTEIGVIDMVMKREVDRLLNSADHAPVVRIRPEWYY